MNRFFMNILTRSLLHLLAMQFNFRKSKRIFLKTTIQSDSKTSTGWINFTLGIKTEDNKIASAIRFRDGKASVYSSIPPDADTLLIFKDEKALYEMITLPPNEIFNLLLKNKMRTKGNLTYLNAFNFYISVFMGKKHKKILMQAKEADKKKRLEEKKQGNYSCIDFNFRKKNLLKGALRDKGVKYLHDPYLSGYDLDDFPRIKKFLDIHFTIKPEICHERPKLLTDWFKKHGFKTDNNDNKWVPELRQAYSYKYLMENKKPFIRKNDLIAGTTTTKETGVVIYPATHGTLIWGELNSTDDRMLFPYHISEESKEIFHHDIFPFWAERNVRESVRKKYKNPLCQELDERFAVYFLWKTAALSHTIVDFSFILSKGIKGIVQDINKELAADKSADKQKQDTLKSMIICWEGISAYAKNLSEQALKDSTAENNPAPKAELQKLSRICANVPENPAQTLDDAVNAVWIVWIGLHMENVNAGLSLGRLDQWFQPYFEADMAKLQSEDERKAYEKHALELICCFYMRCTDHLPLIPDIGNYLFGGSSSGQVITLGGVTPEGEDAVNDMTYIFLKATEILSLRDPNVNARFNTEKNSDTYLKRLCEVNLITAATPSMHNDEVVMASLKEFQYADKDLRDWGATGCVEPTLCGKHMGHTNCMMMNMVAGLEMALNNGTHPLMKWKIGPETGSIENSDFRNFEEFLDAFKMQYKFLIDQSVEYNNILGEAHARIIPTPFLSSMMADCIKKGKDVTKGGARYNSSGAACIGLADVTDSLMVIKKLVFEEKKISFKELKEAVDSNFTTDPRILAIIKNKVPLFGSGSDEAVEMANKITKFSHDTYGSHINFRGGRYTSGFWSMSNHVAFGNLTGAIPSGRLAGKPFTPGLTPSPSASDNLLDNIRDIAKLDLKNMNNNMAFNIKIVPGADDTHEKIVDNMFYYAKTYFNLGGMQMQMNVVTSDMLKDAMINPENYRNLIVRISGYNAYFITLHHELQKELIERAEYRI